MSMDGRFKKEFNDEIKTSEQGLPSNKTQDEHFQDLILQYNTVDI